MFRFSEVSRPCRNTNGHLRTMRWVSLRCKLASSQHPFISPSLLLFWSCGGGGRQRLGHYWADRCMLAAPTWITQTDLRPPNQKNRQQQNPVYRPRLTRVIWYDHQVFTTKAKMFSSQNDPGAKGLMPTIRADFFRFDPEHLLNKRNVLITFCLGGGGFAIQWKLLKSELHRLWSCESSRKKPTAHCLARSTKSRWCAL